MYRSGVGACIGRRAAGQRGLRAGKTIIVTLTAIQYAGVCCIEWFEENPVVTILVILLFAPAIVALAMCAYYMLRFMRSESWAGTGNKLSIGFLGPLAAFSPKAMSQESRKYFARFLAWGLFFAAHLTLLVVLFSKNA